MKIKYFDNEITILESIKLGSRKIDILNKKEEFIFKGYIKLEDKVTTLTIMFLSESYSKEDYEELLELLKNIYEVKKINLEIKNSNRFSEKYIEYTKEASIMKKTEKLYLKYYRTYFEYKYKIKEIQKELIKEADQFSYLILDKYIDFLTKIPNREMLYKILGKRKTDQKILYKDNFIEIDFKQLSENNEVVFLDLNNLKAVNDEYNHEIADRMLEEYIKIKIEKFPESLHFRLGGDEFISITNNKAESIRMKEYFNSLKFDKDIKKKIFERTETKINKDIIILSSVGSSKISKDKEIKQIIIEAEEEMYINKKMLHIRYGKYDREDKKIKNEHTDNKIEEIKKMMESKDFLLKNTKEKEKELNKILEETK